MLLLPFISQLVQNGLHLTMHCTTDLKIFKLWCVTKFFILHYWANRVLMEY